MRQIRAVLCGYYGQGNSGDEALLATLLQMLPQQVIPLVLSGNPAQTRARYGVMAYPRKDMRAVLRALQQAEVFLWGGGSLMQDVTSAANPLYYGGLMGLAQKMGLQTIAWAQGVGPLQRSLSRWITRQALSGCEAVSVRDAASAALVSSWGMRPLVAPDPVWALAAKPMPALGDLPTPRIAVALRAHPLLTPTRLAHLTQALVALQAATKAYLLLIPFQPVQDLPIAQAIHQQLTGPHQILQIEDPQMLKGVFQGVEMTIAMRLHGLIMAAAEGSRCFAISYDPKVSQLMTDLELPGWELAAIPDHPKDICQAWLECYASGDPVSSDRIQSLINRALLHRDLLWEVLK